MRVLPALVVLALALPSSVGAAAQRGFAFGITGGNIIPFSVSITNDGAVQTTGPVTVGRKHLSRLQIAALNRMAALNGFSSLPRLTACPGTLPDVAATFVRVGPRRVQVHGRCMPAFERVYNALVHAVKLSR